MNHRRRFVKNEWHLVPQHPVPIPAVAPAERGEQGAAGAAGGGGGAAGGGGGGGPGGEVQCEEEEEDGGGGGQDHKEGGQGQGAAGVWVKECVSVVCLLCV